MADGIDQRLSNVVEINGDLWVTQTVLDPEHVHDEPIGTDAIAWYEIQLDDSPTAGRSRATVIQAA